LDEHFLSPNHARLGATERARSPDSKNALGFEFDPKMADPDPFLIVVQQFKVNILT
jgi:hypothetical protein